MNTPPQLSSLSGSRTTTHDGSLGFIKYTAGPFNGRLVKTQLVEIQSAQVGRKFAQIDRRPLDPPPVVEVKFYVRDPNGVESELLLSESEMAGFICSVDLFKFPKPSDTHEGPAPYPEELAYVSGHAVHNVKKLVGSTTTQPHKIDFDGRRMIFVFPDLSVQEEGHFVLRYRVFDLHSRDDSAEHKSVSVLQAYVFGNPFRVYSTKDFPGLSASTELTKAISRLGLRVNVRETERKRTKKNVESPQAS